MKLVSTLIFLCFAAFLLSSSPTFPILASAQDPVCGKDAGGAYCPNNLCCSNSGQCGTTVEYCGPDNCQLNCRQCGVQTGGALSCNEGFCCSNEGFCGNTEHWCGSGHCQSQCWNSPPPPPPNLTAIAQTNGDISSIITRSVFEEMLKHRNDFRCQSKGFYSYKAFITAARSFQGFGTTGSIVTRKKELAAFFAQTSALTKGGWPGAPDGLHAWGYCYIKAGGSQAKYYGRGPMQLTHKSMYGLAGQALGIDLIENPNLVATDPVVSFKTAIWFWMTPQKDQPSCHDVITNKWEPSDSDLAAGRVPGYGLITNIINGEDACGRSPNANAADRVQFYKRYCDLLNVNYGDNLDCYHQRPFPKIAMVNDM